MNPLHHLKDLIFSEAGIVRNILDIARLEARLARLSIGPLLLNLAILIVIGLGFWFALMVGVGYLLGILFHNILLGIVGVIVIHMIFMGFLIYWLLYNLKNISFKHTRKIFSQRQSIDYEKLEKTDHSGN